MQVDLLSIVIGLVVLVTTIAVTFYVKDFLQKRNEYQKLRKKLERVAGKHAEILYPSLGFGGYQLFKIDDIDKYGITITNNLQTIFIPANKLLQSEMIIPCEDWDKARIQKMKEDMEEYSEALFPAIFEKMFPAIMEATKKHLASEIKGDGEFSMVLGMKFASFLKDEGLLDQIPDDYKKKFSEGS